MEMVNRQAKDNDTESSINGILSMAGSMLKQKNQSLAIRTFYFAPSARSSLLFQERCNCLCWKGIFWLGVNVH